MTPDLENTVVMTMDGLNDLYTRAHNTTPEYTAADAIGSVVGVTLLAGALGGIGYVFSQIRKGEKARNDSIDAELSEVSARIAELKEQLGE